YSVNPVMVRLKREFPQVRWVAQFGDPWAGNPLERRLAARIWARINEWRTVRAADHIVHNSETSLVMMVERYSGLARSCPISTIPHPFESQLYPCRPKRKNLRLTLRHVGVLFGRRSPEPLFSALLMLL